MSAQTHSPTLSPPPPSSRRMDRAQTQIRRLWHDPNPVWMREMRQSARLVSTPVVLAVVTVMTTLLLASIGGAVSIRAEPAKVGTALFHTFFSIAFFVVFWVAPAVAAATISSERGNRTWEALVLTGLGTGTIARGKFLAAITYVSLYLVMLAPVGGLTFLFGGVTATEVITAYILLGLFAALAVAFGLTISSSLNSPALAIVVTLMAAVPLSLVGYVGLGPLLSVAAHKLWPLVPEGPPVWLPTAYARADFSLEYVTLLVLAPLILVALPAWFFYEVTVANMASPSDDRSTGVRRWMCVGIPTLALGGLLCLHSVPPDSVDEVANVLLGIQVVALVFCVFIVAAEPLGPSRRVLSRWKRDQTTALRRFFGPGILKATALLMLLGTSSLLALGSVASLHLIPLGGPDLEEKLFQLAGFTVYYAAFFMFLVGFAAYTRARSTGASTPRLLLLAALFLALVGPWIGMAIGGALTEGDSSTMLLAAPSPTFAFVMSEAAAHGSKETSWLIITAGFVCSGLWALGGLALFGLAAKTTRRRLREHERAIQQVEAQLAEEDSNLAEPA